MPSWMILMHHDPRAHDELSLCQTGCRKQQCENTIEYRASHFGELHGGMTEGYPFLAAELLQIENWNPPCI